MKSFTAYSKRKRNSIVYYLISLCLSLSLFLAGWNYKERNERISFERERERVCGRKKA